MTTVFVTHDQTEAVALADRIAVMEAGELQQLATPGAQGPPANIFVACFIGEPPMNLLEARLGRNGATSRLVAQKPGGGDAVLPCDGPETRRARRSDQAAPRLPAAPASTSGGERKLAGTVVSNLWLGDQTHLGIEVGGAPDRASPTAPWTRRMQSTVGSLPADALHLFDADERRRPDARPPAA